MRIQQLTRKLRDGDMQVVEVQAPAVTTGLVLVRNLYFRESQVRSDVCPLS